MDEYGKIYILLYNHDNSKATATTIVSAFEHAFCKKNVFISVYQELITDADVYKYLQQYVKTKEGMEFIDHNVGIVSVDRNTSGYVWALQELIKRQIFVGSKWCFLTQPGNIFLPHWDHTILKEYHTIHTQIKPKMSLVLTSFVITSPSLKNTHQNVRKDRYMFSDWMDNLIGEGQHYLKNDLHENPSFFPTVREFKGYLPIITEQRFSQTPKDPTKTVCVTTQCMFCRMDTLSRALTELELFQQPIASYAIDMVFSAALWMENGVFYSCKYPVIKQFSKKQNIRPDGWDGKKIMELLEREYRTFFEFVGVDLTTRQISGRAMMGILPKVEMRDILSKYGSVMEYDRMQRSFGIKI